MVYVMIGFGVLALAVVLCLMWRKRRTAQKAGKGVSLLIPFRSPPGDEREQNFLWLKKYWANELPGAEVIQGYDVHVPFSKTAAVNNAALRAHGDVLVIIDADAYLTGDQVLTAAALVREHKKRHPTWVIPYRRLYRLNHDATGLVLGSDPADPVRFSSPPPGKAIETDDTYGGNRPDRGHWFGAMCMVVSARGFWSVAGMDERFAGWGGEDVAFMLALDTLHGPHKTIPGDILHLHHERIVAGKFIRKWEGQGQALQSAWLSREYRKAAGDPKAMTDLLAGRIAA